MNLAKNGDKIKSQNENNTHEKKEGTNWFCHLNWSSQEFDP